MHYGSGDVLIDTSALIAIIDDKDPEHGACVRSLGEVRTALLTTWSALTEAMHLVRRRGGWSAQERLWQLIENETIRIAPTHETSVSAVSELMDRYRDHPMDLADATLVEAAELTGDHEILTLDAHFHAYRLSRNRRFTVLPA